MKRIYIFGAHSRAKTLGKYITSLYPDTTIQAYLYNNDEDNPCTIDGIPVISISEESHLNNELPVYIATRGVYHDAVTRQLQQLGFTDIIPVTPELDRDLRGKFLPDEFAKFNRCFNKLADNRQPAARIYVASTIFDRRNNQQNTLQDYESVLQVGKALTDTKIEGCSYFDNVGDNISENNRQFCELTGLYWLWQNATEDIIGLEHYRRRFILEDNWIEDMNSKAIDVILPTPLYVHPNIAENYRERHTIDGWNTMLDELKKGATMYQEATDFFENTGCYSPCNMLIARRSVLDDLCSWLFPIIFAVHDKIDTYEDSYQNRYPGFLSERLITFFFYHYEKKYNVVYCDKNFLG